MRNPLKSEETAFRFVLGVIVYLALIAVASLLATWLGVVVFVALTVAALLLLRGGPRPAPVTHQLERAAVEDTLEDALPAHGSEPPSPTSRSEG